MNTGRDRYLDLLRVGSLTVVVLSHLAFTVLKWTDAGPRTTSPLEFVPGLWIVTWLLQVMPLFFYIGGYAHLRSSRAFRGGIGRFTLTRLRGLLIPAAVLGAVWAAAGLGLSTVYDGEAVGRAVKLILSPLWFLGVYAMLVALLPAALWLHRRAGLWALPILGGAAVVVDVARFGFDVPNIGWANLVLVWGAAHQAGLSHERWRDMPRKAAIICVATGLGLLSYLVAGLGYPGAMVGVPGRAFSNMTPPTVAILALLILQIGLMALMRPAADRLLSRPRAARAVDAANRYALPVFLFHTTGAALFVYGLHRLTGVALVDTVADASWWSTRPVMLAGSALCTVVLVVAFGRKRPQPRGVPGASATIAGASTAETIDSAAVNRSQATSRVRPPSTSWTDSSSVASSSQPRKPKREPVS
ncbi:acyltransferase [Phytomonospora sp. NPDC050363]|uniref:acyltransferase family protein n=1 Tax=Phytomonospora sp. NPDC050363 TaxID=3155642 RepID=UPI0033D90EB7